MNDRTEPRGTPKSLADLLDKLRSLGADVGVEVEVLHLTEAGDIRKAAFEDALQRARRGGTAKEMGPSGHDAVGTLRAAARRYERGCLFKQGDLVTPIAGGLYNRVGEPMIVLETFAGSPIRVFDRVPDDELSYGSRFDMRVAVCADGGAVVPLMVESWCFDYYGKEE
jgi:hypothetical protein